MTRRSSSPFNATSLAVLGGVFVLGIGIGIGFNSVTPSPSVADGDFIDRNAPNRDLCIQYGASSIVVDTRIFVTLNPFNVYVAQPSMRPGCVMRTNNWAILEQRGLVTQDQVRDCKNRMNTFGFTGTLESDPQISCVYQNDAAKNLFLTLPGVSAPPETQRF